MATKRVRMTPLMEGKKRQKKKQKHQDGPSDGREEEAEAKGGTRGEERKKQLSLTPVPALTTIKQVPY